MGILILFGAAMIGGIIPLYVAYKNSSIPLKLLLSFSGAFLFGITILELLPEVYSYPSQYIGLFIILGFLIQIVLEHFSKGIEHGHIHHHEPSYPYGVIISLCLHGLIEGIPISVHNNLSLIAGISIHHIPAAFALASLLKAQHIPNRTILLSIVLFGIMSPLGVFLGNSLKGDAGLLTSIVPYCMAIVIGIFLHISTTIVFESSVEHTYNYKKMTAILFGIGLAVLSVYIA
jgi:zinc and cadmium transporter